MSAGALGKESGNTHIILAVGWKDKKREIYFAVVRREDGNGMD